MLDARSPDQALTDCFTRDKVYLGCMRGVTPRPAPRSAGRSSRTAPGAGLSHPAGLREQAVLAVPLRGARVQRHVERGRLGVPAERREALEGRVAAPVLPHDLPGARGDRVADLVRVLVG